ncbi:MAG: hypothetical protein CFE45_10430, partial [Burkholderiales bacterium PBB5]
MLACAQAAAQEVATPEVSNSGMDAPLFYQLLVGEMQLSGGSPAGAFEILLDAARRQGDEQLFQRAVEIALQSRAGDQALAAAQAWRTAKPRSTAPLRYQTQILLALNRHAELAEPLKAWVALAPADERPGLIASL